MTKIDTEKCMISIIWSFSGIHSLLALTKDMKYNSQYLSQHIIPDIRQTIRSSIRITIVNGVFLHRDNARTHNSQLSSEKIESGKAQKVLHPL
jgi:hypothetical protein